MNLEGRGGFGQAIIISKIKMKNAKIQWKRKKWIPACAGMTEKIAAPMR
jgi:hypothetical protein